MAGSGTHSGTRIGVDVGGSKIEIVALAADGGERLRRRAPTPVGSYEGTVRTVVELVRGAEAALDGQCSVGVGIPGALSPATGLVKNANSTWLIGRPLDRDLAAALDRPVRLDNDANCFALSEATDGAAAGAHVVFAVILGTGVGGGLAVGGRPHSGRNAVAGEWGHNPLPWPGEGERPGPACYCGKQGCVETFLSGPALAADAAAEGLVAHTAEIAAQAEAGDRAALAVIARYADRLARALATVINVVDPDVIVLGGGLSNIGRLYRDVPPRLPRYVFSDMVTTPIVPPRHGDASGVRGAACLWPPATGEAP